jgi:hypothetical protein
VRLLQQTCDDISRRIAGQQLKAAEEATIEAAQGVMELRHTPQHEQAIARWRNAIIEEER